MSLKDIRLPDQTEPKTRLYLPTHTADLLRRLAKATGMGLPDFLDELIRVYAKQRGWEVVEAEEPQGQPAPAAPPPERRTAERRVRPPPPGPPSANRRRTQRRKG